MSSDYSDAHLERVPIGTFAFRAGPDGRPTNPSPLDGLDYCVRDIQALDGSGKDGNPNRVSIAAYTGDETYLTLYGDRDPTDVLKRLSGSKIRW